MKLKKEPVLHYFIDDFQIREKFRSQGFGNRMVKKVNEFLKNENIVGVLLNGAYTKINAWDIKTRKRKNIIDTFYQKNDWKQMGDNSISYMVFNATEEELEKLRRKYHIICPLYQ